MDPIFNAVSAILQSPDQLLKLANLAQLTYHTKVELKPAEDYEEFGFESQLFPMNLPAVFGVDGAATKIAAFRPNGWVYVKENPSDDADPDNVVANSEVYLQALTDIASGNLSIPERLVVASNCNDTWHTIQASRHEELATILKRLMRPTAAQWNTLPRYERVKDRDQAKAVATAFLQMIQEQLRT